MRNNIKGNGFANLLIVLFIISIFTPYIYRYYLAIPLAISMLFFIYTVPSFFNNLQNNYFLLASLGFLIVEIVYRLLFISTAPIGNYGTKILTFAAIWMGVYISQHDFTTRRKIFNISVIVLIVNVLDNMVIYHQHPELLATGVFTDANFDVIYGRLNIGKTAFSYYIFLIAIALLIQIIRKIQEKERFLLDLIVFLFFSFYVLVYTGSGTVIISYLLGIPLIIVFSGNKTQKEKLVISFIICLIAIFVVVAIRPIISFMLPYITQIAGEKTAQRFNAIMNVLSGSSSSTDMTFFARITYITIDLKNWTSSLISFVFGNGFHSISGASTALQSALINKDGGHSGLFDSIARYGLFGVFFVNKCIKYGRNYLRVICDDQLLIIENIVFGIFLFNIIFNDIINCGVFFIIFAVISFSLSGGELYVEE